MPFGAMQPEVIRLAAAFIVAQSRLFPIGKLVVAV